VHSGQRGTVRLYRNVDQRYIHEDFFAKLNRFARGAGEFAKFD
jgi:purine nucleosidase